MKSCYSAHLLHIPQKLSFWCTVHPRAQISKDFILFPRNFQRLLTLLLPCLYKTLLYLISDMAEWCSPAFYCVDQKEFDTLNTSLPSITLKFLSLKPLKLQAYTTLVTKSLPVSKTALYSTLFNRVFLITYRNNVRSYKNINHSVTLRFKFRLLIRKGFIFIHHHHQHQGLDPLIRSVSMVTAALDNVS
jgi:hypothetical protein